MFCSADSNSRAFYGSYALLFTMQRRLFLITWHGVYLETLFKGAGEQ